MPIAQSTYTLSSCVYGQNVLIHVLVQFPITPSATPFAIDIKVSRSAIRFQKNFFIILQQCTNTTLNFASRFAHLLAAYYSNIILTQILQNLPADQSVCLYVKTYQILDLIGSYIA